MFPGLTCCCATVSIHELVPLLTFLPQIFILALLCIKHYVRSLRWDLWDRIPSLKELAETRWLARQCEVGDMRYSKSHTYEPSSLKHSKMQMCPGKDEERQEEEEVTEELKRFTTRKRQGVFFICRATVGFWGTGPIPRTVHESCSSSSECSPALPCQLWWEEKSYYSDITGSFFQEGR